MASSAADSDATPAAPPGVGSPAPTFTLPDQHGKLVDLASFRGRNVFVYFYPKAMTPGCTTQAQLLRDISGDIDDTAIIGISPDPPARLAKFDERDRLGFTLLSDESTEVAQAYGVWVLKKLYGREYMGVQRSGFLIGTDGTIEQAWPKLSPKDTPTKLLAALGK